MRLNGIEEVTEFCRAEGIPGDLVGRWIWVRFPSRPDKGIIEKMKGAGFRWVAFRGEWAHDCGHPSKRGPGDPRAKYGSLPILEEVTA